MSNPKPAGTPSDPTPIDLDPFGYRPSISKISQNDRLEIIADKRQNPGFVICLHYMQNERAQDIWFSLMISAIEAQL